MSANLRLDIRPVEAHQVEILRQLAKTTFITAFGPHNTEADMRSYVATRFSEQYFHELFQQRDAHFFLAFLGDQPVAYIQLNVGAAQNEHLLEQAIEIERIYVHEDYQGKGYGLQLLNFSLDYGRQLNKEWIWLGVWDQNDGAIRFYERHGFSTFSQHDFYLGSDRQIDLLMKRKL